MPEAVLQFYIFMFSTSGCTLKKKNVSLLQKDYLETSTRNTDKPLTSALLRAPPRLTGPRPARARAQPPLGRQRRPGRPGPHWRREGRGGQVQDLSGSRKNPFGT